MSKGSECPVCELVVGKIEEIFCQLVGDKIAPDKCKRLMEQRRMGRLSYDQLVRSLGLKPKEFDTLLDRALEKTREIVEPKHGKKP